MFKSSSLAVRRRGLRHRFVLAAVLGLIAVAGVPSEAGATLRVVNHNDPAGDQTVQPYRLSKLSSPAWDKPFDFTLSDGWDTSYGPGPGTYTVQALPPAGWQVADIQCVGPSPNDFAIDVPNGRVTMIHGMDVEQTCSFTNRKGSPASGQTQSQGVAPSPPASELSKVLLPGGPALVRVRAGRGYAAATVRITQRSVVKAQLLWRGTAVGATRVSHSAGTHVVKVSLKPRSRRQLVRRGLKRVTLTLRVVVVGGNRATHVFRYRVLVRLT